MGRSYSTINTDAICRDRHFGRLAASLLVDSQAPSVAQRFHMNTPMPPRPIKMCLWAVPLIVVGCLGVVFARPNYGPPGYGCFYGTVLSHAFLASFWAVFGPGNMLARGYFSCAWVAAMFLSFRFNMPATSLSAIFALFMAAQCFVTFVLLIILRVVSGARLKHRMTAALEPEKCQRQFGLGPMILLITLIGVSLGVGRLILSYVLDKGLVQAIFPWWFLFASAALAISLPFILAALLPRMAIVSLFVGLLFAGIVTLVELNSNVLANSPGSQRAVVVAINVVVIAWTLLFSLALRLSGYTLRLSARTTQLSQ